MMPPLITWMHARLCCEQPSGVGFFLWANINKYGFGNFRIEMKKPLTIE
jgi:hypothetical protein